MSRSALVIADFNGQTDDELSVSNGNIIQVITIYDDGWCDACFNGNTGIFPSNYLDFDNVPIQNNIQYDDISDDTSSKIEDQITTEDEFSDTNTNTEEDKNEEQEEEKKETPEERAIRKEKERIKQRQNIINEVRITEDDYVKDLGIIVNVFSNPLKEENILSVPEMVGLFSNVEVLLNVNNKLNEELKANLDDDNIPIGEIFLGMADFFKMYTSYCANQPKAMEILDKLGKNPSFKAFTDKCMLNPDCRGLTLFSFLIKPIQRICKYPLLLRDLLKNTPDDHEDYDNLVNALAKITEVVDYVNERKRLAENLQKILDVQHQIESNEELNLVSPSRRFVSEKLLSVMEKNRPTSRNVYLFNDLVVITKPKRNATSKDHFKYKLSLNDAKIIDVADTDDIKFACEICPKVVDNKKQRCIIVFQSVEEKYAWVKEIKALIKEFQRRQYMDAQKLAQEGGIAISVTSSEDGNKEKVKKRDSSKISRREKKDVSPTPSRSPSSRKQATSIIGNSFSWRKHGSPSKLKESKVKDSKSKVDINEIPKHKTSKAVKKDISKTLGKQMAQPKVRTPNARKKSSKKACASVDYSGGPPKIAMDQNFSAQLAATLASRKN